MGSSGSGKTQTTTAVPWAPQGEALQKLFAGAAGLLNNPPDIFPGSRVAERTPQQIQAEEMLLAQVPELQRQAQVATQGNELLLGAADVGNNPVVQNAIQAALNPLARQFTDVVLPSLKIGQTDAGTSSRQGVLEANALRDFNETSGNVVGRLMGDFYKSGLEATARGAALAPGISNMVNLGAQNVGQVGDARQLFQQAVLDDEVARFVEQENQRLTSLANFRNLIMGNFGGTTTGPTGVQNPSRFGSALGTGLTVGGATKNPWAGLAAGVGSYIMS